jgi:hypothetical protein
MDENRFWSIMELAWQMVGCEAQFRQHLTEGSLSREKVSVLLELLGKVIGALDSQLDQLSAKELLDFDRILERKLYEIDRRGIHDYSGGSDDGFLYIRGFVVAAGKEYYEAVSTNPAIVKGLECQDICYLSRNLYEDKFGMMSPSEISRESCSNELGWPDPDKKA